MTQPIDEVTALTRRYAIDVNLGTVLAPNFQRLLGVREFKPMIEPTHEDDSVYEDEGWHGEVRTALAWSLEIKISHRVDDQGQWNPVHRHLRDSRTKFGTEAYVPIRYYDRNGAADDAWEGFALVTWAPEGGDHTNPDRVDITLTGKGKLVAIANPEGELQDPEITSLDPTSGPAAGGNLVHIHGHWFVGVTDVDFGANPAAEFEVISTNRIVAVAPAGAGTEDVSVTTATGTSANTAADDYTYV